MDILKFESSFIVSAAYDEGKELLRLEMGDSWYYYYGITKLKMARFKKAISKGTYFCKYIKGKYKVIKRKIR